jgi:hypothetical protein
MEHGKASNDSNMRINTKNDVKELYLMEKLYQAMINDKKRGKPTSVNREFYLMEKLYQVMLDDKNRNKKRSVN